MRIRNFFLVFFILVLTASFAFAQEPAKEYSFEVRGKVVDAEKVPYGGMSLIFEGENFKGSALSNGDGNFLIKLPAGKYQIKTADSTDLNAFIEISEKGPNPTGFDLVVELNKNWCTNCFEGKMPQVIKRVAPSYPPAAKATGVAGEVLIKIKIDKEGNVVFAEALSGHPLLRSGCRQAAQGWTFSRDESVNEREVTLVFSFTGYSERDIKTLYRKPNRIEIYSNKPQIDY
jgi:hypothetical protein